MKTVRSFDLFDTLVARKCYDPHEIFRLIEDQSGTVGFAADRLAAEGAVYHTNYSLDDIYEKLRQITGREGNFLDRLKALELDLEFAHLFPIKENCAGVRPGDIIVSDMYLPRAFVLRVVRDICGLEFNPLFLSAHGKRSGTVWAELSKPLHISRHIGDNETTDLRMPTNSGIASELTTIAQFTEHEKTIVEMGYKQLALLIRQARLMTYSSDRSDRDIQLMQVELNFPFLLMSSLALIRVAREKGWTTLLFSSRDCFLWLSLFRRLIRRLNLDLDATYFLTSRIAKVKPSLSYLAYFDSLCATGAPVIVDLCGTGWSSQHLVEQSRQENVGTFLIHALNEPWLIEKYNLTARNVRPGVLCSLTDESHDNTTLELLNRAQHPMVEDVGLAAGVYYPLFCELDYDPAITAVISRHHEAFSFCNGLLDTTELDFLASAVASDHGALINYLYREMAKRRDGLSVLYENQHREEYTVWDTIRRKPPMTQHADPAVPFPNLTAIANSCGTDKGSEHGHSHNYAMFYSFLFEQFRLSKFNLLEIGLLCGGVEAGAPIDRATPDVPSVRMWLNFFPNAKCFGFDISDFSGLAGDRFEFIRGDLSISADLDHLAGATPPLKIIIDDGSHASFHQQHAFTKLFGKLEPGGFYVIEDLHWQPDMEAHLPRCRKTADVFETFLHSGTLPIEFCGSSDLDWITAHIANVFVHRSDRGGINVWSPKMVVIQRRWE